MNSSEFMLNNQVYTQNKQKEKHKNETQTKAIINLIILLFWSKKEAYNFVLFINVQIMAVIMRFFEEIKCRCMLWM
jgi:hypothetical protein